MRDGFAIFKIEIPAPESFRRIHPGDDRAGRCAFDADEAAEGDAVASREASNVAEIDRLVADDRGFPEWCVDPRGHGRPFARFTIDETAEWAISFIERKMDCQGRINFTRGFDGGADQPIAELGNCRFGAGSQLFFRYGNFIGQGFPSLAIIPQGHKNIGRMFCVIAIERRHRSVPEKGRQGVKFLGRDWVELVVMTSGAAGSQAEPDGRNCFHAVLGVDSIVFLIDRTALPGGG